MKEHEAIVEMARVLRVTETPLDDVLRVYRVLAWHFAHVDGIGAFIGQNYERLVAETTVQRMRHG